MRNSCLLAGRHRWVGSLQSEIAVDRGIREEKTNAAEYNRTITAEKYRHL